MARLSESERIDILIMVGYGDKLRSHEEACALFNEVHNERPPISRSTVSRVVAKYHETRSVKDLPRTGRPKVSDETKLNALLTVQENPHATTTEMARHENVSQSFIAKFLTKMKFHPYKARLIHELTEDDPDRRIQFCEGFMQHFDEDPQFLTRIVFSDEATFCLNGAVNRHNCRYWSQENPHWTQTAHTQYPQKVNVWIGVVNNRLLGPYFFDSNVTAERYLHLLQTSIVPDLIEAFPDPNNPHHLSDRLIFQQDGAPPHYALQVRRFLDNTFPGRWIGRRGPIEWPPRSPDLTPLDFFLWGHLKNKVYIDRPQNLQDLVERIREEANAVTPEMIQNSVNAVYHRVTLCQMLNGEQFEHLL